MESASPAAAPALSTPDTRIFEDQSPKPDISKLPRLSDEQLRITYEISRTVDELRQGKWKRIALQFPDHLLVDAPRVFQELARGLKQARRKNSSNPILSSPPVEAAQEELSNGMQKTSLSEEAPDVEEKLYILADTSYGACCVDEVAAEHANADVVVHYGRSCLSPTVRLPVIYVFTKPELDLEAVSRSFSDTYKNLDQKIVLMADIPFQGHLTPFAELLHSKGFTNIFTTDVIHNVASPLPNRTVPAEVTQDESALANFSLFHISDPPPSLLLTVSSRVHSIFIYPTTQAPDGDKTPQPLLSTSTASLLRRRYALLTRLSTAPVIGILINTLSVASYMDILAHLKRLIASAGKKAYTFVVGKVNAAKVANFAEVGGWVVVGCWESSLFDSTEFWKPIVTPWELELALLPDDQRVWTGQWRGDFGAVLAGSTDPEVATSANGVSLHDDSKRSNDDAESPSSKEIEEEDGDSEEESAPPDFDLRTGRYVSHSRPMGRVSSRPTAKPASGESAQTLIKRANGDLATIGGAVSPAAEFLRNTRSWKGLGSDFAVEYDAEGNMKDEGAAKMEVGRRGIARGYVFEHDEQRR